MRSPNVALATDDGRCGPEKGTDKQGDLGAWHLSVLEQMLIVSAAPERARTNRCALISFKKQFGVMRANFFVIPSCYVKSTNVVSQDQPIRRHMRRRGKGGRG